MQAHCETRLPPSATNNSSASACMQHKNHGLKRRCQYVERRLDKPAAALYLPTAVICISNRSRWITTREVLMMIRESAQTVQTKKQKHVQSSPAQQNSPQDMNAMPNPVILTKWTARIYIPISDTDSDSKAKEAHANQKKRRHSTREPASKSRASGLHPP